MALSARPSARLLGGSSLLEFPNPGGGKPTPLSGKQPCAWGRGVLDSRHPSLVVVGWGWGVRIGKPSGCTNPETKAEPQQIVAQGLLSCLQYPVS